MLISKNLLLRSMRPVAVLQGLDTSNGGVNWEQRDKSPRKNLAIIDLLYEQELWLRLHLGTEDDGKMH